MNKKLMAVAVGAALAAPMTAFSAVELSGRVNAGIGQWSATGATAGATADYKSRLRVWDSGSKFTVKASEDLGGGLSTEAYIETGLNVDTGTANGQGGANSSTGPFGSRQAWVGLSGNFGKVTFGRQNTWYGSGNQDLTQAVYLDAGIQFATGVFANGPGVNRLSDSFRYTSPQLGPVNVLVTYSTNNAEGAPAGADADGKILAVTVEGNQGPASFGFDNVSNQANSTAGVAGAKRGANKLRGGFSYQPGARISLIYVMTTTTPAGGGAETKQNAMQISWEHAMGNIGLHAGYGKLSNLSTGGTDVAKTGTTAMQLGVRFIQSKSTWAYVNYVAYTNDTNARTDFNAGGMSSAGAGGLPAGSVGADPKSLAFGISHNF